MKNTGILFFIGCITYILIDLGITLSAPNRGKWKCEGAYYPDGPFGRREEFSVILTDSEKDNMLKNVIAGYSCKRI